MSLYKQVGLILALCISICTPVTAIAYDVKEYGIVLLLEDNSTKVAAELNKQIAAKLPELTNVNNNWHVTLYHGAYTKDGLDQIYAKLQSLKLEPLNLKFISIYPTADRWIGLGIEKSEGLQQLHTTIVKLASPYHKRPLQRAVDTYADSPVDKRQQIDTYGVAGILEMYKPQMTLFYQYPANSKLQEVAKEITAPVPMSGQVAKLAIGELGYNGNIVKIIYTIDLPNVN